MTTKKNSSNPAQQPALPTGASASATVSATVVMITPAIAGEMLKRNTQNRPVSDTQVDLFAKLITEGNWRLTHQGIAFDSRGDLIDGQHRLWGIIAAGIAVPAMVVRGLDHGAIEAVDTGLVRRAHHVLAIVDGVTLSTNTRAALIAAMILVRHGRFQPSKTVTVHDLRAAHAEHGVDVAAISDILHAKHDKLGSASITATLAMAHRTRPAQACQFARLLRDGAGLHVGHPVLTFREYALRAGSTGGAAPREDISLRLFAAFDAFVAGTSRSHLKQAPLIRAKYLAPWRGDADAVAAT